MNFELASMDELYAAAEDPFPTYFNTEPLGVEEVLQAVLNDPFCAEIRCKFNKGRSRYSK